MNVSEMLVLQNLGEKGPETCTESSFTCYCGAMEFEAEPGWEFFGEGTENEVEVETSFGLYDCFEVKTKFPAAVKTLVYVGIQLGVEVSGER